MNMMTKMITGMIALVLLAAPEATQADVLVTNNFEDGTSQDWTLTGSATLYQYVDGTDYSYTTPYAIDMSSGGGGGYATLTTPLALASPGYTNVTWTFYINGDAAAGYNKAYAQYSDDGGTNWVDLASWTVQYLPTGFLTYSIPATDLSDNFLFRFYMTSNTSAKHAYLDNMVITATPDVPPAGTVVIIK